MTRSDRPTVGRRVIPIGRDIAEGRSAARATRLGHHFARRRPPPQRDEGEGRRDGIACGAVVRDLDAFWQRVFAETGMAYRAPSVTALAAPVATACGRASPAHLALYCPVEEAIYYSPAGFDEHRQRIGDFAPIVVLAHEWGHHIQRLLGVTPSPGNAVELQADCLAGVYARDAGQRCLLDPGDITEAVAIAAALGDPLSLPQDAPGAHGIDDDRISAFMRGYLGGLAMCELTPRSPDGNERRGSQHEP